MFGQRVSWDHVAILTRAYARYAIRGGAGIVYLLIFVLVGLSIAAALLDPLSNLRDEVKKEARKYDRKGESGARDEKYDQAEKDVHDFVFDRVRPIVAWWLGVDDEDDPQIVYLIQESPALLSVIFLILLPFVPFTTCFGAFNQFSSDVGSRGLRYFLLRTERINIFLSRVLGTLLFVSVVSFLTVAVVVLYTMIRFGNLYSPVALLRMGLWGWLAVLLFSLPYICLCSWISSAVDSAFGSLVLNLLVAGFPVIFLAIAKTAARIEGGWLQKITPWGWKYGLMHPNYLVYLGSTAVMAAFSALLFFLAMRHFMRRDL